jgi:DNA-binding GntR family transcriptional regulator
METISIASKALQTLRYKIIVGELKAGYKLNELDISRDLGISRIPLREALRILEKDSMVANVPRKGTYVSELSLKDFIEVSQAREMVESYSIDLLKASNNRSLPSVEVAFRAAQNLPTPFVSEDPVQSTKNIRIMLDFHSRLVEATGNSMLSRMYESIGYTLSRYQYIYFHINDAALHSLDDHKSVLDLISRGEFDLAKEALKKHIGYTVELVKNRVIHKVL